MAVSQIEMFVNCTTLMAELGRGEPPIYVVDLAAMLRCHMMQGFEEGVEGEIGDLSTPESLHYVDI